jgi:PBP1b-binding outer membrane lipoprotein LpoB
MAMALRTVNESLKNYSRAGSKREGCFMKKQSFLIIGTVLVIAAVLVLSGCGKSPKALAAEMKKLEQQALSLDTSDVAKLTKLSLQSAKLMTQVSKLSEKDAAEYAAAYADLD